MFLFSFFVVRKGVVVLVFPALDSPPPSSDDDVDLEKGTRSGVSARLFSPPTLFKKEQSRLCACTSFLSLYDHILCVLCVSFCCCCCCSLTSETTFCVRRGAKMKNCRAFSFPHIKIGVKSSNHGRKNRTHDDQNADGNHRSEQRGRAVCFAEIRRRRSVSRVGVNVQCV